MKCLTIKQPWAHEIVHGDKRIENRTWATGWRGPLAIHAGKTIDRAAAKQAHIGHIDESRLTFGAVVATCLLVECVRFTRLGTWIDANPTFAHLRSGMRHATGPFCWILTDVVALARPVPVTGKQGLYELGEAYVREIERAMP